MLQRNFLVTFAGDESLCSVLPNALTHAKIHDNLAGSIADWHGILTAT